MEDQDYSPKSRRRFLQKFGSLGLGTLAVSAGLSESCTNPTKDQESGKKITLLNSKNELVEVDSAYISNLNKNLAPNHNSESRKGLPGKKFVMIVDLAKCKSVGMNDYIAKPVDEKLLYRKIVNLVQGSDTTAETQALELKNKQKARCTDMNYLIQRTKSNPKLMMEMILLYLEQTPPLINTMKKSLYDKDWNLLYSAVHKMIPSFSIMGISVDFENMARKVQDFASTQQQADGINDMVNKLENICNQACSELKEEFNNIKSKTNELKS